MDAVFKWMSDNMVILGFVVGLAVKYVPALKFVPNTLIPYLNTFIGILTGLFGAASTGVTPALYAPAAAGGGFLGMILGSALDAIYSALVYEVFGRHPLDKAGIKKA